MSREPSERFFLSLSPERRIQLLTTGNPIVGWIRFTFVAATIIGCSAMGAELSKYWFGYPRLGAVAGYLISWIAVGPLLWFWYRYRKERLLDDYLNQDNAFTDCPNCLENVSFVSQTRCPYCACLIRPYDPTPETPLATPDVVHRFRNSIKWIPSERGSVESLFRTVVILSVGSLVSIPLVGQLAFGNPAGLIGVLIVIVLFPFVMNRWLNAMVRQLIEHRTIDGVFPCCPNCTEPTNGEWHRNCHVCGCLLRPFEPVAIEAEVLSD